MNSQHDWCNNIYDDLLLYQDDYVFVWIYVYGHNECIDFISYDILNLSVAICVFIRKIKRFFKNESEV